MEESDRPVEMKQSVYEKFIENLVRNGQVIGEGLHKKIYQHPTDESKVVAVFKHQAWPLEMIKSRFYLNKILHLLFPENIPDIHLAASQPFSLILDKANGLKVSPLDLLGNIHKSQLMEDLNRVGVTFDPSSTNFIKDKKDKTIKYVDTFSVEKDGLGFTLSVFKLRKSVLDKLEGNKQLKALSYLQRLNDLQKTLYRPPKT